MQQDEKDPIRISDIKALDKRFAWIDFGAGNSPRDLDNSIAIRGCVAFGERHQAAGDNRNYRIGIKGAFLEVREVNCQFKPNLKLQDIVQHGQISEEQSSKTAIRKEKSLGGKAEAGTASNGSEAKAKGHAGVSFKDEADSNTALKSKYEIYKVRWEAGGCRFGDRERGNPYDKDGVMIGRFLDGEWGEFLPHAGTTEYGARFTLVVAKGGLFVERLSAPLTDQLPFQKSPEDRTFDALKAAVASWVLESQLSANHSDGFDKDRLELVLAQGEVIVNLDTLPRHGLLRDSNKLPEASKILTLPPSQTQSAKNSGKRQTRASSEGAAKHK